MEGSDGVARGGLGRTRGAASSLPQRYRLIKILGIGSFGKVKLAEHVLTKRKVAIKILNRSKIREMEMEEKVEREITILKFFARKENLHPHIVRLYEVIETPTDIFVVMEYMKCGELFYDLVEKGRLQETEARRFFQQLISGVEYCHRNRVAHRDLKPENLLLDESKLNIKIIDFGLSNIIRDGHFLKTRCGTPSYAAPEVLSSQLYAGPEVDVWSCGVILYALLCGTLPFDTGNCAHLYEKIKAGIYALPSHLSLGPRDLISRMLVVDPTNRITIPEVLQHPWFQAELPRYLAVAPEFYEQETRIDPEVLRAVVNAGFDQRLVIESLSNRVQNQATVSYYLLRDRRSRLSNGLQQRRDEVAQVAHVDPVVQSTIERPGSGTSDHRRNSSASKRKCAPGLNKAKESPRELMVEVLKALHDLEISWMRLGSFCFKCRWVPPSRAGKSNSDSPARSGSRGFPTSSNLAKTGSSHQGGDSASCSSAQGGEEHGAVEFQVQLSTVREEKYELDLQRLEGPHVLFLDLFASFSKQLRIYLNISVLSLKYEIGDKMNMNV